MICSIKNKQKAYHKIKKINKFKKKIVNDVWRVMIWYSITQLHYFWKNVCTKSINEFNNIFDNNLWAIKYCSNDTAIFTYLQLFLT
jgi:hypothetical protein